MNIIPFDYAGQEVRTITKDGEPWFVGKDVATILGYTNTRKAVSDHCKRSQSVGGNDSLPLDPQTIIISEPDVYRLIMRSKLPGAEKFEEWVCNEVLPTIRKTGGVYLTLEKAEEILFNPDLIIGLANQVKELHSTVERQQAQIAADRPKTIFADAVSVSHTSILIGELAKLIKQNGVEMGQKRLFSWMRDNGYLMKIGSSWNLPTQRSMEQGLFEVKEGTINQPDGTVRITRTTKVTGKGQVCFINKFLAEGQTEDAK